MGLFFEPSIKPFNRSDHGGLIRLNFKLFICEPAGKIFLGPVWKMKVYTPKCVLLGTLN